MLSKTISKALPLIRKYFKDKPILKVWLFGSYARSEETETSDIDLLVDYDTSQGVVSLLTMGGILMDLSDIFGKKVDLVDTNGLKDFARESVNHDKILIYERIG